MLQIKVFGTTPPCANCKRAEKQALQAIGNAPALVVGDLVKFVGLAPSKESLIGALREAGLG